MEDQGILELFLQRSEQAVVETDRKYGKFSRVMQYLAFFYAYISVTPFGENR